MKTDDIEFEVKFYPVDKEKYREKLRDIGAVLINPERKMYRVVADYRDNPIFKQRECIRVRNEGGVSRLSYKSFEGNTNKITDQKEIETEVKDFDSTVRIFEKLGIVFNRKQETKREEWDFDGVQITIDTWPGLDTFTEIEGHSEDEVKNVASLLGFDWNQKLVAPASMIYSKVYGVSDQKALEMISNITFDNPPFNNPPFKNPSFKKKIIS